jgi:ubiquinone/menaquinone biosynthesis C-methylase UbiE
MPKSRRSSVERYHDRVAHRYDTIYDDAYWQWHDALTWDYLKPHLPRNLDDPVIDLGCGTGKWGRKLLHSGYRVTFLDISREMLDQAQTKLVDSRGLSGRMGTTGSIDQSRDRKGEESHRIVSQEDESADARDRQCRDRTGTVHASRASFIHADLVDLTVIPDGSFALAAAFGDPICCASSPQKALKQIHRILRPDGMLVATFDHRLAAIDHFLEKGDPGELARFLRDGKTNWLTKDRGERFELHTFDPSDIRKLMTDAGFEIVEMIGKTVLPMRRHRHLLENAEARRAWMKIEKSLSRDPDAIGRASHIQIAARATGKHGSRDHASIAIA